LLTRRAVLSVPELSALVAEGNQKKPPKGMSCTNKASKGNSVIADLKRASSFVKTLLITVMT
jgi:phage terminase large subunit-like protein